MSRRVRLPSVIRRSFLPATLTRSDVPWLGGTLLVGLVVSALYLATNSVPANGAGLYTVIADEIRAGGYALPETIPHYTVRGVPFAYPPLMFYVLAGFRAAGADVFTVPRFLPPLVTIACLVPAYLLGRDLLGGRLRGAAAAIFVGLNPQILEWHISAGGVVRAPAFLFALCGAYAGLRLFRDRERAWVPVGLVSFLLVVLTHPTYALFVVVTDVLFWAGYDRTLRGLLRGAVVGCGGLVLAAPWWSTVASTHGFAAFTAAAGTHGGVGGGLVAALEGASPWTVPPLAAGVLLLLAGWRVIPAWLFAALALFEQLRFAYVTGTFAFVGAAVVLAERLPDRLARPDARRSLALAALVVVTALGVGALGYEFTGPTDETTPEFVDERDVAAMHWAADRTAPDATFVVLGDAAEWFPAVADRTILLSPWGLEWRDPAAFERHLAAFEDASACRSADCVEAQLATVDADPAYLYVPRDDYTIRGERRTASAALERSLETADRYELAFENDGVAIYRVRDGMTPNRTVSGNDAPPDG